MLKMFVFGFFTKVTTVARLSCTQCLLSLVSHCKFSLCCLECVFCVSVYFCFNYEGISSFAQLLIAGFNF